MLSLGYLRANTRQGLDRRADPLDHRIAPGESAARILHALGVDPASKVTTMLERSWQACEDKPELDPWG
jgi:hypothetical protein